MPRSGPWIEIAVAAYSEQVGMKLASARTDRMDRRRKPTAVEGDDGKQEARHDADVPGATGAARVCRALRTASASGLFKNTHNLRLKFRKFEGQHVAAGMEDEIETDRQQIDVAAQSLAHAALDAIAFVGFAQNFAHCEADARPDPQRSRHLLLCGARTSS